MTFFLTTFIQQIPSFLIGILGLTFLIAFHEFGHFFFCKLFNIHTPSFSIGMGGPVLFSRKIGSTVFKFSLFLLGGYVEIAGSNEIGQGEQLHANAQGEDSFAQKPFWQKFLVMIGGILFNMIFAYSAFILVFWTGAPKTQLLYPHVATPVVAQIMEGGAAQGIITPGDTILSIDGRAMNGTITPYLERTELFSADPVRVALLREGNELNVSITPLLQTIRGKQVASLGIVFTTEAQKPLSFSESCVKGVKETHRWIKTIIGDLRHLFSQKKVNGMAGPLMIIHTSASLASQGAIILIIFLAIISINLALLNLLPLPILDGGQIIMHGIGALFGRPLPERIQTVIYVTCWVACLLFFIFLSWQDIVRIVTPLLESTKTVAQ